MCVSCGRQCGRFYQQCPYCGEQVWQTRLLGAVRRGFWFLPVLLLLTLWYQVRPEWLQLLRQLSVADAHGGFILATGIGLLLLPVNDRKQVATSRKALIRWHLKVMAGGWLMGCYAISTAICLAAGRLNSGITWLLAIIILLSLSNVPLFFNVPWRNSVASVLLFAGTFISILPNAG